MGLEPIMITWEAIVLPLHHTRTPDFYDISIIIEERDVKPSI